MCCMYSIVRYTDLYFSLKNVECTSTQLELSMALSIVVDTATSKPGYNGELDEYEKDLFVFDLFRMDTSFGIWIKCNSIMST